MPLDNTASIKDIITSLQNLEGINAKAELASVIGSPVTDEDTMSTMVNQIQTAKNELASKMGGDARGTDPLQQLVDNVEIGVQYASGTCTSSGESLGFHYTHGEGSVNMRYAEITSIPFVPKKMIISFQLSNGNLQFRTIYEENIDSTYPKTAKVATFNTGINSSGTYYTYNIRADMGNAVVSEDLVRLPISNTVNGLTGTWEAWG